MTIQDYLIVENNVVTNIVIWDGNTQEWQPPENSIALVASETPSKNWELDAEAVPQVYVLKESTGGGAIGFTWDGSTLMTPDPQPPIPENQILATIPGTTT